VLLPALLARRVPAAQRICYFLLALLLGACDSSVAPLAPTAAPPLDFMPIDQVLAHQPGGAEVRTAGYVIVSDAGAELVGSVSFSSGPAPQVLDAKDARIWLGLDVAPTLKGTLRSAGAVRYAIVLARGRLEGPGTYGPTGGYRYQMMSPSLQPLAPEEVTIVALLAGPRQEQLVRVVGALLARADSALLVEDLGAGGLPAPKARQVKLRAPLRDVALLAKLRGSPNGAIRYGQVQVEGFWRDGVLTPLSIIVVS